MSATLADCILYQAIKSFVNFIDTSQRTHGSPHIGIELGRQSSERFSDGLLEFSSFQSFFSESGSPHLLFDWKLQLESHIRSRKSLIRMNTPLHIQSSCHAIGDSTCDVSIANDIYSILQVVKNGLAKNHNNHLFRPQFPSICREQEVDTMILYFSCVLEVLVNLLTNLSGSIFTSHIAQ